MERDHRNRKAVLVFYRRMRVCSLDGRYRGDATVGKASQRNEGPIVMGLNLLVVAAAWIGLAALLSMRLTSRVRVTSTRWAAALVTFVALLPLPLLDEIVAKRQFERLCRENNEIKIDRATAVGKSVYFDRQPQVEVPGTLVRVVRLPMRFADAATGETVVSYNILRASGGMLVRLFGFSEGGVPLLFRGSCAPVDPPAGVKGFKALGIDYVEPPANREGTKK